MSLNSISPLFLEVLDARIMIEKWAGEQIIEEISEKQITNLKKIVTEMDALLEITPFPFDDYSQQDMKFHQALIEWANNQQVKEIYASLNTHVALSRIVYSTSLDSTINRHKDHWDLVDTLEKKDLKGFHHSITAHIESLKKKQKKDGIINDTRFLLFMVQSNYIIKGVGLHARS